MTTVLALGMLATLFCLFVQFARQEYVQDDYEEAIVDIEGRLEWARTRKSHPFGMKAQLEVSCELLHKAKSLWQENKWQQAYHVALQSQGAMNRAQRIYSSVLKTRQRSGATEV
ncbi:MAG: hypothetical protein ACWGOX_14020 [Desulforhopalus sp.]